MLRRVTVLFLCVSVCYHSSTNIARFYARYVGVYLRLFRGRKFLKLLKRLTADQVVPEIPLSVDNKLELLLKAFVFAKFPYTSPYTHAFVRVCILPCIIRAYIYNVHDRGTEGYAL